MDDSESLLEFPCRFPIKVMGRDEPDFADNVLALVVRYAEDTTADDITTRTSSKGKFIALTVTISATSRDQLDAIYKALSASEQVAYLL
jgi:putative lipoic acid-binding regulatory protein